MAFLVALGSLTVFLATVVWLGTSAWSLGAIILFNVMFLVFGVLWLILLIRGGLHRVDNIMLVVLALTYWIVQLSGQFIL
ncbi:MAG TPA: hypothetical protein DCP20_04360 [Coriobacteriia bacterium]|nr:MAG: hypothetical protein XD74_0497 [Actinobacteria bacterium 66_15]HAL29936.1 hypothetical protein [Coriobacteriia bacterium]